MRIIRQVLLFIIFFLNASAVTATTQFGYCQHDYFECCQAHTESKKAVYDAGLNFLSNGELIHTEKTQSGSFFAFELGLVATKGGLGSLRGSYLQQVDDLAGAASSIRAAGVNADDALKILAPLRNQLKLEVRRQGPWWAARAADIRNIFKYGNRAGPSADDLIKRYGSAENALEALGRTSSAVNRATGAGK